MKTTAIASIEVQLTLTEVEAAWLRAVMQNPLSDDPNPENEDPDIREMRITLFAELDAILRRYCNQFSELARPTINS